MKLRSEMRFYINYGTFLVDKITHTRSSSRFVSISPMAIAKTFCVILVHQYLILNPSVRGEENGTGGVNLTLAQSRDAELFKIALVATSFNYRRIPVY